MTPRPCLLPRLRHEPAQLMRDPGALTATAEPAADEPAAIDADTLSADSPMGVVIAGFIQCDQRPGMADWRAVGQILHHDLGEWDRPAAPNDHPERRTSACSTECSLAASRSWPISCWRT